MEVPTQDPRDESIADLVNRLLEDGRRYAQAEIDLMKEIARHRAARARTGLVLLVAGAVLGLSALTALVLGFVLGHRQMLDPGHQSRARSSTARPPTAEMARMAGRVQPLSSTGMSRPDAAVPPYSSLSPGREEIKDRRRRFPPRP